MKSVQEVHWRHNHPGGSTAKETRVCIAETLDLKQANRWNVTGWGLDYSVWWCSDDDQVGMSTESKQV